MGEGWLLEGSEGEGERERDGAGGGNCGEEVGTRGM